MQFIVLASGRGSRLKRATKNIPKCLVKVNKKSIINYISPNFKKFDETIILTGYKSKLINDKFPLINKVKNKNFATTNMVYSLFCARKLVKQDIIISYSDIIYCETIINKMIKLNYTHVPLNNMWLSFWRKRMRESEINNDAENLIVRNNKVSMIGEKIGKKRPKLQFMGLLKLKYEDYFKLYSFYIKLKNKNIDMTSFLNLAIKNKIINLFYFTTSRYWYEIDSLTDQKITNKLVKINKS